MKKLLLQHTPVWFFCSIILLGFTTACEPEINETFEPILTTTEPVQVEEEISTTVAPMATEDLSGVLLVASPESDPNSVSQIQSALSMLLVEGESVLLLQESLSPDMITLNVKVVIGVGPNLNLSDIAASKPDVSFVAVEDPTAIPASNLSVIGDPIFERQSQAFLAGYLSALISEDYKVAALIPEDIESMDVLIESYMIGAEFFCGVCNPLHPPYNDFPYWQTLSIEDSSSGFEPVIDSLVNYGVEVIFIPKVLTSSELLSYVASLGMKVISDGYPDLARNNWVGTVTLDLGAALVDLWPSLITNPEGVQIPGAIILTNTDAGLVSEGRRRLFDEMAADLQAGLVSPRTVP